MESQKRLFNYIQSILPDHVKPVNEISELLGTNTATTYERMGGRVPLKINELVSLAEHFNLSLDEALGLKNDNIPFSYVLLAADDPEQYIRYMRGLEASIKRLAAAEHMELTFAADDIPVFHFMNHPELTYFKLYAWYQSMSNVDGSYEQFMRSADDLELRGIFKGIAAAYRAIPTTEIWTEETISPMLSLLAHYRDFGKFDSSETLVMLCRQLLEILERVERWAADSRKDGDSNAPYSLYLCPVQPGSSIMLSRRDGVPSVRIKLYTINSVATDNPILCEETQKWMDQTISKSTNLTRSSEIARARFFDGMKAKVRKLMP